MNQIVGLIFLVLSIFWTLATVTVIIEEVRMANDAWDLAMVVILGTLMALMAVFFALFTLAVLTGNVA